MKSYAIGGAWSYNEKGLDQGVYSFLWDEESGELKPADRAIPNLRVGGTCWHPAKNIIYCPSESSGLGMHAPAGSACIYAVEVDPETGKLNELSRVKALCSNPSYVAVDRSGKYLLSANHGGMQSVSRAVKGEDGKISLDTIGEESNLVLFKLAEDGRILDACDFKVFPVMNGRRSTLHFVMRAPCADFFTVTDIHNGAIYSIRIDEETDSIVLLNTFCAPETSSARYGVFHPTKPWLFVNNENSNLVCAFEYDENGLLKLIGTGEALPADYDGHIQQSDIRISPDVKYLYVLIREINCIAVLRINDDGTLERIQLIKMAGESPKGCAVSPDGRYLYVAAKVTGVVLLYSIGKDGKLTFTKKKFPLENAANIAFVSRGVPCR